MTKNQSYWITHLSLEPHPEGGYFRQVLRSSELMYQKDSVAKPYYTSIYFLLTSTNPSHFHQLNSDEVWYYHYGSPLAIHLLYPNGTYEKITLGPHLEKGQVLQAVVPKTIIFGSTVEEENSFSLVSCMVSPGFDYADFKLFSKESLLRQFPKHSTIINRLTYETIPD